MKMISMVPVVLACSLACSGSHKARAIRTVVASDAVADELAEIWEPAVDAQVTHCRQTVTEDTKEARAECMGIFGKGKALEAGLASLVVVQTAIKEAVKCEELNLACAQNVDWNVLYTNISAALDAIVAYYRAAKGAK